MSDFDGFEVMPYINQRTNKGKIAARDKRIEFMEDKIDGTRTISIPTLAFNYVNNRLESIGTGGELYYSERAIRRVHAEPDYVDDKSRWFELFGTPERAARTMAGKCCDCCECVLSDACDRASGDGCLLCCEGDHDALLEWLGGDA